MEDLPDRIRELPIYQSFRRSPWLSIKHASYFDSYEELLGTFRSRSITLVEIGVLHGGSLFMWRDYLGPQARIIGIDIDPEAERWRTEGFEIHIGNQADPAFWESFFESVGDVDIVIDDGGHTNAQQIVTVLECAPHIRDGGRLIVEDTHCSYLPEFGNPSGRSFISWTKVLMDQINSRSEKLEASHGVLRGLVHSVACFDSIVCLNIHRGKCIPSGPVANGAPSTKEQAIRPHDEALTPLQGVQRALLVPLGWARRRPRIWRPFRWMNRVVMRTLVRLRSGRSPWRH